MISLVSLTVVVSLGVNFKTFKPAILQGTQWDLKMLCISGGAVAHWGNKKKKLNYRGFFFLLNLEIFSTTKVKLNQPLLLKISHKETPKLLATSLTNSSKINEIFGIYKAVFSLSYKTSDKQDLTTASASCQV